jgi:chorismate-pyruvate lyase
MARFGMTPAGFAAALVTGALLMAGPTPAARAAEPSLASPWTASLGTRLEALALLETLNAELLSHDSATLTLERWCGEHRLADPAVIVAQRTSAEQSATGEQRAELGISATEPVRHRHVRLVCDTKILSEADNWYVPARLTPDMNTRLDATDAPFGKVVQPLHFTRHTLSASLLWHPLPDDWAATLCRVGSPLEPMRRELLQHHAILLLPDGTPFSEVIETYTDAVLDFPVPAQTAPLCP